MMEQFEKWKSKNCEAKNCPHEASCNGCENMWRAALEWAMTLANCGGEIAHYELEEELES